MEEENQGLQIHELSHDQEIGLEMKTKFKAQHSNIKCECATWWFNPMSCTTPVPNVDKAFYSIFLHLIDRVNQWEQFFKNFLICYWNMSNSWDLAKVKYKYWEFNPGLLYKWPKSITWPNTIASIGLIGKKLQARIWAQSRTNAPQCGT